MKTIVGVACLGVMIAGEAAAEREGETCAPAADVSGEPALVEKMRAGLKRRGVGAPVEGCPALRVWIAPEKDELVVSVEDDEQDRDRRVLGDVGMAVILVEAWARSGVVAEPAPASDDLDHVGRRDRRGGRRGAEVAMSGGAGEELFVGTTSHAALAVCWQGERACHGVRVAIVEAIDTDTSYESLTAMGTVDLLMRRGLFTGVASFGLGVQMATTGDRSEGMTPTETDVAGRSLLALGGRLALNKQLSIDAGVGSEMVLDERTWRYARAIATIGVGLEPDAGDLFSIPQVSAQASVGLRYKFR